MPQRARFPLAVVMAGAVAGAMLGGCYESADVTMYEPGVYKGKPDSAAVLHPSQDQHRALSERFRLGQSDR